MPAWRQLKVVGYFCATTLHLYLLYYSPKARWLTLAAIIVSNILFVATNSSVVHTLFPVNRQRTLSMGLHELQPGEGRFVDLTQVASFKGLPESARKVSSLKVLTWYVFSS